MTDILQNNNLNVNLKMKYIYTSIVRCKQVLTKKVRAFLFAQGMLLCIYTTKSTIQMIRKNTS